MGLFFTMLYVVTALFSPASVYPQLIRYRIELWIAIVALLASVPNLRRSRLIATPQAYLMFGLFVAVGWSMVVNHWIGGAVLAWGQFLPSAIVLFLVAVNCRSLPSLKILATAIVISALVIAVAGTLEYHAAPSSSLFVLVEQGPQGDLMRLRGLGFLNDPNDLAQFLVVVMATLGIAWHRRNFSWNLGIVVLPMALLGYAIFLTKSRGAIIAIAVMLFLFFRKHFGRVGSIVITAAAVMGLVALNFSGGRGISDTSSFDRIQAWGAGLALLKSAPLFGIGYNQFVDHFEITAHNSFLLCAAELGFVGYFFWMALLVFSVCGLNKIVFRFGPNLRLLKYRVVAWAADPHVTSVDEENGGDYRSQQGGKQPADVPYVMNSTPENSVDRPEDLRRWAEAIRIALAGFLTAAWFLSRAYVMTLFLYLGFAIALQRIADRRCHNDSSDSTSAGKLMALTVALELCSVILIYAILRIRPV